MTILTRGYSTDTPPYFYFIDDVSCYLLVCWFLLAGGFKLNLYSPPFSFHYQVSLVSPHASLFQSNRKLGSTAELIQVSELTKYQVTTRQTRKIFAIQVSIATPNSLNTLSSCTL